MSKDENVLKSLSLFLSLSVWEKKKELRIEEDGSTQATSALQGALDLSRRSLLGSPGQSSCLAVEAGRRCAGDAHQRLLYIFKVATRGSVSSGSFSGTHVSTKGYLSLSLGCIGPYSMQVLVF